MAFTSPPNIIRSPNTSRLPTTARTTRRPFPQMSATNQSDEPLTWKAHLGRFGRTVGISAAAVAAATMFSPQTALVRQSGDRTLREMGIRAPSALFIESARAAAKFSKKSISEKLSQVPVFAVTNASGQPYLAKMDGSGSQIGLIFFSHLDALNMLKDMQKNPGASDARVYIMGLDKAYEMVKAKPTPSGIRGSGGEELTMVFRFYPDSKQVKAAEGLQRKLRIRQSVEGVPVFVAKGLTLRKGSENVVPLFLTKEDLDAAWSKLRDSNKDLPNSASVVVGNLLYIIQQMETDEVPELRNLGFFAPRASVEYVTKEQAGPTGQARMHQNPLAPAE